MSVEFPNISQDYIQAMQQSVSKTIETKEEVIEFNPETKEESQKEINEEQIQQADDLNDVMQSVNNEIQQPDINDLIEQYTELKNQEETPAPVIEETVTNFDDILNDIQIGSKNNASLPQEVEQTTQEDLIKQINKVHVALEVQQQAQIEALNQAQAIVQTKAIEPQTPINAISQIQNSAGGSQVSNFALQFVGNPYIYGGTSLTEGCDCSGFVMSVYEHFGISLPHNSDALASQGAPVSGLENAQPGDVMIFPHHTAIYIGNGQIVHAESSDTGIVVTDLARRKTPPTAIRRMI